MMRKKTLTEYYRIFNTGDLKRARDIIKEMDYDEDPFLLSQIANTYLHEGKLRLAERFIVKAFILKPTSIDVLWILGIVRWDYGQLDSAIFCFQEIIRLGIRSLPAKATKQEKEIRYAQINDSKLQLYRLLKDLNPSLAKRYLTLYKKGVREGIFTLYKPLEKFI